MTNQDFSKAPTTVGELRQRLIAMGNPWKVSPHLSDDDPLPQPPRGGQAVEAGHVKGLKPIDSLSDFGTHVHAEPPSNLLLARRWVELGILRSDHAVSSFVASDSAELDNEWGVA